jgi:hypothetical protein
MTIEDLVLKMKDMFRLTASASISQKCHRHCYHNSDFFYNLGR